MDESFLHSKLTTNAFRALSKALLIIPFLLIIIALFIKVIPPAQSTTQKSKPLLSTTPVQTQSSASAQMQKKQMMKFDLKGPYVCTSTNPQLPYTVSVKNNQVYAEVVTKGEDTRLLLKDDCIYNWDNGEVTGKKMCGVSTYIGIFESLAQFNMLDIGTLLESINQVDPSISLAPGAVQDIASSCKKVEIKDTLFTIPSAIKFVETELVSPQNLQQ